MQGKGEGALLARLLPGARADAPAGRVAADQDQRGDAIGVAHGVFVRNGTALRVAEQTEPRQLWTSAGVKYHAAQARLDLARGFLRLGDATGARAENAAAERTGVRIRSRRLQYAAAALARDLVPDDPAAQRSVGE